MVWEGSRVTFCFSGGSDGKESACNVGDARDVGLIPGLGNSPKKGDSNPFQYPCLEESHGQKYLVGQSTWSCKKSIQLSTVENRLFKNLIFIFLKK